MEEWWQLSHLYVTVLLFYFPIYLVNPAITDVTVDALCGGTEECSLAIYLTGVQQAVIGLGSVVMMPMIGKLSDAYGRKNLMTIPIILQIIPIAILAWNRTRHFYYAYYVLRMLTDMVVDGGVICLALSYLADSVEEKKRVAAFSVLSGVMCGANVSANFAAGLLSIPHIFQVATAVSILAALYVRFILNDTARLKDESERLIEAESSQGSSSHTKTDFIHQIPSPKTVLLLLKSSTTFALAASVCFFNSLSESGAASF